MKKVFLSFSPQDLELVKRLILEFPAEELEFDFCEIPEWLDSESADASAIKEAIGRKIIASAATLCLIGEKTHSSAWVNIELTKSRNKGNRIFAMALKGITVAVLPQVIKEENITFYPWNPKKLGCLL